METASCPPGTNDGRPLLLDSMTSKGTSESRSTPVGGEGGRRWSPRGPFVFIIHEYYPQLTPAGLIRKSWSVDKDGYASLPQGPGLGAEIDEQKLEELAKKPHKPEWPTRGRLKDGSIADY